MFQRPPILTGVSYEVPAGCCNLHVTVNYDDDGVKEVFVSTDGAGCSASLNGLGRAISVGLQSGITPQEFLKTLQKAQCPACIKNRKAEGRSCPAIIAKLLVETDKHIKNESNNTAHQ